MLKKILIAVAALVVLFLAFVVMQPNEFRVSRALKIDAPAADIFPYVNNQSKWAKWSPWLKLDPKMQTFFEGEVEGVGSVYKWSGNKDAGKGTSTIVESKANQFVKFKLDFEEPMKGTSTSEFIFAPESDKATIVTWTIYGENNFAAKLMGLIYNCEESVGGMFEEGLNNLKTVSEKK